MDEKLKDADWWRLNKLTSATEAIEWTYQYGGWVRAKLDSLSTWSYKQCPKACYAKSNGEQLIWEQKKGR